MVVSDHSHSAIGAADLVNEGRTSRPIYEVYILQGPAAFRLRFQEIQIKLLNYGVLFGFTLIAACRSN